MRTVTFKSVLYGVARLMGFDPSTGALSNDLAAKYAEFITNRVAEGWQWADWPELMAVEARAMRPTWIVSATYITGSQVYNPTDGLYYTALSDNTGVQPDANAAVWVKLTSFSRYIPLDPWTGETGASFGTVYHLWKKDPSTTDQPGQIHFQMVAAGIQPEMQSTAKPYVEYRLLPPHFTTTAYSSTASYAVGDRVYNSADGECYEAIQAGSGNALTDTAYWTKQNIPQFLELWTRLAAYADALQEDGQNDKAAKKLGDFDEPSPGTAYFELQQAQLRVFGQQRQQGVAEYIGA